MNAKGRKARARYTLAISNGDELFHVSIVTTFAGVAPGVHLAHRTPFGVRTVCGLSVSLYKRHEEALTCRNCLAATQEETLNNDDEPEARVQSLNNVALGEMEAAGFPVTSCSVVWLEGHPWVLDGEPGLAQRWVGVRKNGSIGSLSMRQMYAKIPTIVYTAAE